MTTPLAHGHAAPTAAMEAAAASLASLLAGGEPWPPVAPLRLRNLLLDACGSDHRALVELLLRVGRHGIADALRALGTVKPDAWPAHRTRLVARACGELFIGAEIAAWAVDAWAVALSVVPAGTVHAIQRSYEEEARRAARERERAEAQAAAVLRSSAALAARAGGVAPGASMGALTAMPSGTGRLMGTPGGLMGTPGGLMATPKWGGTAATLLHTPSWAGGAAAPRVGAWRRGRSGPPRWRVSATPLQPPDMRKFFALFAVVATCMFGVVTMMRRLTPTLSVPVPIIALPETAQAMVIPPTLPVSPPSAADSSTASAAGPASSPRSTPSPSAREAPSAMATPPAAPSRATAAAPLPTALGSDLVASGIGGQYEVQHRILSVHGNGLCDPVAESLARRQLLTVEEITHTPGEPTFALATRTGVIGTLQPDGVFATSVHRSTYDNVRIVFRMTGRFTRDGFVARTTTETDAIIKYRMRQQCLVLADLIGTRRR